jgi:hypothetical protein
MRNPMRAALRLALPGWLALVGLSLVAAPSRAAAPPEKVLPDSAVVFLKINNAAGFREAFKQTQIGQMIADPALQPLKDDIKAKTADTNAKLKQKVGVTIRELLQIPQGTVSLAILPKDDANAPITVALTADAGKNAAALADVLARATAEGEKQGSKVSKETLKNLTLHVVQPPKPKDAKETDPPPPPLAWTQDGTVFVITTDVDVLKDLVGHSDGRDASLSATVNFAAAQKKLGSDAHAFWYVDVAKLIDLVGKAGARGKNAGRIQDFKGMAQLLGVNGLKAIAGTFTMNHGSFDSEAKTFILAPAPLAGLLKLFPMPKTNLRPEPWVPKSVASYQSFSWNLDEAYVALNDLANQFQPGVLNVLEQQLVGPNGGEPLSFKKDIFDPLGKRITVIGDFKKPITEDSQRMLVGVRLKNATGFQNTLAKLIALAGGAPKKRDFQGTTIYDFDIPNLPNANPGVNAKGLKGPISVTIAKETLFIATEPTLLEQVLRGGGETLADDLGYQAVAKEIPSQTSTFNYVKPEESARLSYEMIKSGQFQKALAGAAVAGGPDVSKIGQLINKDKLPDFSVFAKYLSQGGGYSVMEDDGITITSFSLRKTNP